MEENRLFDEYFGTFPGATGFYDSTAAGIFEQPGLEPPFLTVCARIG
jgi:phospholipase C